MFVTKGHRDEVKIHGVSLIWKMVVPLIINPIYTLHMYIYIFFLHNGIFSLMGIYWAPWIIAFNVVPLGLG